jgi:hypothetical protein
MCGCVQYCRNQKNRNPDYTVISAGSPYSGHAAAYVEVELAIK